MRCVHSRAAISGRTTCFLSRRVAVWLALFIASKNGVGQTSLDLTNLTSIKRPINGFQVNSASSYMGVFSLSEPRDAPFALSGFPRGFIPGGGAAASFGWYSTSPSKKISVGYDISYDGNLRYSALNSLNHLLLFDYRTKLAPRLDLTVSAVAESTGLAEYLFRAPGELRVVQQSGSPEEFAGGVLGGTFSSLSSSLPLTDLPVTDSPLTAFISDSRLESASAGMNFTYSQSRRMRLHSGFLVRRNVPKPSASPQGRSGLLFPSYSDGTAYYGFSYSLSRQTDIGADVGYFRTRSARHDSYTTRTLASLGRRLTKEWLIRIQGGFGTLAQLHPDAYAPKSLEYEVAAMLGYRSAAHSVLASVHRSIGDRHGLDAGNTVTSNLVWSWQRPGGKWAVTSSGGYESLGGRGVRRTEGWLAHAGVTRHITRQTSCTMEYVHGSSEGGTRLGFTNLVRRAARVSVVWTPLVGSLR